MNESELFSLNLPSERIFASDVAEWSFGTVVSRTENIKRPFNSDT